MTKFSGKFAISTVACAVLFVHANARAECEVTYDDGSTYISDDVTSCASMYPVKHPCSIDHTEYRPAACAAQDMFKVPNPDAFENTINNVKKGLWSVVVTSPKGTVPVAHDTTTCVFDIKPGRLSPNSIRAIGAARDAGFRSVELDTHLLWDAFYYKSIEEEAWAGDFSETMIGHSEDYWAFTSYNGRHAPNVDDASQLGYVWNTTPRDLSLITEDQPLYLLDIDLESVGEDTVDEWVSVEYVAQLVADQVADGDEVLIIFDPKYPREPRPEVVFAKDDTTNAWSADWVAPNIIPGVGKAGCDGSTSCNNSQMIKQFNDIVDAVRFNDDSWQINYLAMSALKTTLSFADISDAETGVKDWDRFSWVPAVNNRTKVEDAASYLQFIDEWVAGAGQSVLFIDTNINGPDWWQGNSFSWDGETFDASGTQWSDVTDYINENYGDDIINYSLRAQWWQPVAQQNIGSIGKYATEATLIPNDPPNWDAKESQDASTLIGDLAAHLIEYGSDNAVVTQDRPDIYLQIRNRGKQKGAESTGVGCVPPILDRFENRRAEK